jgi:hypothetical protein
MELIQTTLDNVPVGGILYGYSSGERYTKIGCGKVRPEEGPDKGELLFWGEDYWVLVEAPQTPPSQQDEIWYDSLAAAPVKERKSWHVCFLCLHEPYGNDGPCRDCNEGSEWSPCKPMLEWHEEVNDG